METFDTEKELLAYVGSFALCGDCSDRWTSFAARDAPEPDPAKVIFAALSPGEDLLFWGDLQFDGVPAL